MAFIDDYDRLAKEVLSRPPRLGRVRLVAIDGGSGAGKTVFTGRLLRVLDGEGAHTEVVHTDDLLDGWADQFTFWPRLDEGILAPLARGEPGRYRRYDWAVGAFAEEHPVPVPDVLIVEGVSVARAEVRVRLTLAVFIAVDQAERLSRALARDGAAVEPALRRWMAAEQLHFARDATAERADVLVDGGSAVEHDPDREYVRLR